jgi:hypothetical protein
MWHRVVWQKYIDFLEEPVSSIFRAEAAGFCEKSVIWCVCVNLHRYTDGRCWLGFYCVTLYFIELLLFYCLFSVLIWEICYLFICLFILQFWNECCMYYWYLEIWIIYLLHISCTILILLDCQPVFKIVVSPDDESSSLSKCCMFYTQWRRKKL